MLLLPSHLNAKDITCDKKYNRMNMSISQIVLGGIRKIKTVQHYYKIH